MAGSIIEKIIQFDENIKKNLVHIPV